MQFGARLAEIRKDYGYSQQDLADQLNVSRYTVSSWEQGRAFPSLVMLKQICELLEISSDYLLCLIDWDPGFEHNRHHYRFSEEERRLLQEYMQFLLFQRKSKKTAKEL